MEIMVDYINHKTLSMVKLEPQIIGQKGTIIKGHNALIQLWILLENKWKNVIIFKDFNLLILWEVELDLEWELF